jgi:N-acetylglutamate synthase-like GNAT family acetyltransferase
MQLFVAKPADAAPIAAFLTACTGKRWDEMLIHEDIADKKQYCVKQDDRIIAVCSIKSLGNNAQLLYRLYVQESLRGKGIGSSILRLCCKKADQSGISVYAECPQRDEQLLHFLQKNGFRQTTSYTDKETVVAVCGYLPKA